MSQWQTLVSVSKQMAASQSLAFIPMILVYSLLLQIVGVLSSSWVCCSDNARDGANLTGFITEMVAQTQH